MREIKFRVWDRGNKIWQHFTLAELAEMDKAFAPFLENWCEYTDLKDKNGVEIYEGDLVKTYGWASDSRNAEDIPESKIKQILFYDGAFIATETSIDMVQKMNSLPYTRGTLLANWCRAEFADTATCEVIGNIYENPELLTEAA